MRSNGFKLKEGRFSLDIKKIFFTIRAVKHWNKFLGEVVRRNIQGQVGRGSEQPVPVEDVTAHCRRGWAR